MKLLNDYDTIIEQNVYVSISIEPLANSNHSSSVFRITGETSVTKSKITLNSTEVNIYDFKNLNFIGK